MILNRYFQPNKESLHVVLVLIIIASHGSAIFAQALQPVAAENGMVVSTDRLASLAGLEILKKGGNAIDAAIATAIAMAVTYPSCGNIGGEGFLMLYGHDATISALDFRLQAPAASTPDMFLNDKGTGYGKSHIKGLHITDSPISIGIPGTVAGLALAHRKFGHLPWSDLIEPAVKLAENGFKVSERLHNEMKDSRKFFMKYPSSTQFFLKENRKVYEPGEIWKQPDLAATLRRIQEHGEDDFYRGKTAELIVASMKKHGGLITMADLNNYRAIERKPDRCMYRGYDIYAMPLPSSGGIIESEILNILEGYDLEAMGHNSALYLHVLTEAMRRAYRDRALYLGDSDFVTDIPVDRLKSKDYAGFLRTTIDLERATKSDDLEKILESRESRETTHFSVVDSKGNAVSVTYTLNGDFGAYLVADGTGIVLNNSMPDFNSIVKEGGFGKANLIEPGKRPLSSMTPTIVAKNGKPVWIIGSPGGTTIISSNVQIMLNLIDFKMNIAEAVAAPRIFHGWSPDETVFQKGGVTTKDARKAYKSMGHKVKEWDWAFGPAHCIHIDHDRKLFFGAADRRSPDALAAGY
jgi:gamma-glutamyltranspeptidase/glutathione hydrolase